MTWSSLSRSIAIVAAVLTVAGCEWFSTMSRTDEIQPYEVSPILPPEGSVALDGMRAFNLATADDLANPAAADAASTARGEAVFEDFCLVCHGDAGVGNGPIADKFPAIPALNTGRLGGFSDGYLFALVTQGRGLMPAYGRIPVEKRWDLVNYLRTIQ